MSGLLRVKDLSVTDVRGGEVIVNKLSFELRANSCLGIVGESGSGKSMTARAVLGLLNPWLKTTGSALFTQKDCETELIGLEESRLRHIRGREICMILQDAMTAFDPLARVGSQMAETFAQNLKMDKKDAKALAPEVLAALNIRDPEQVVRKYPHQLSGGMLQRCMIAIALAMKPAVIIADEPTTALDAVNQQQVVEAFELLRQETGTALIFISHDLGVVKRLCDDLFVMEKGCGVEAGRAEEVFRNPQNDYTRYLIDTRLMITDSFKKAMKKEARHEEPGRN
ncbi:ABC transporter ATP-binding protein [Eubacterium sp. AM05-23]|mgnify:FL=1|uniref:ABC transporter ATP-binding protein n=1 Tax=Eubacterium TaxID=1730 RepID=UPI000E4B33C5|nr:MULTISPECIES: ABC transporter ATP-binding protein [Eubacterium]RHO57214.1 ABC transporter ATP-binding protein [Eubacterium sp. AM05-23]